jgi:O-antigen/teichoic acid export membrane protein
LSVYALASTGLMSVDIFFVKAMVASPEAAGYYAAGQNIARIPLFLVAGLAAIILPAVAGAGRRGVEATAATASRALRWALIIVIPMAAVILATSTPLVELVYSASYRPAGAVLAVLSPAMAALAMSSIVAGILGGVGRVASPASSAVAGLAVTAIACLVLTPMAGAEGAAMATLIGSLVALTGMVLTLWRALPGSLPLGSVVRVGTVSIVVGSVAWLLPAEGASLLVAYAALGILSVALLLGTRELTLTELQGLIGGTRRETPD